MTDWESALRGDTRSRQAAAIAALFVPCFFGEVAELPPACRRRRRGKNFYSIADPNSARHKHRTIERDCSFQLANDANQHGAILCQSIGVVGGHDAALPQLRSVDAHIADSDYLSRPVPFSQALNSADQNIGAKAAAIKRAMVDGSVGGDQQREDIKTLRPGDPQQRGFLTGGLVR